MLYKIRLTPNLGAESPDSKRFAHTLEEADLPADGLVVHTIYLVETADPEAEVQRVAEGLLRDPVLESAQVLAGSAAEPNAERLLAVLRRTGVMDPAEQSLMRALKDSGVTAKAVKTARQFEFARPLSTSEAKRAAALLGNEAVDEARPGALLLDHLPQGAPSEFRLRHIPLAGLDDKKLAGVNAEHRLSLNLAEMRAIRDFFAELSRDPTDIELQMLAQTWSEHCKHKTLTGKTHYREEGEVADSLFALGLVPEDGRIDNVLKQTIKRATDELNKPWCLSVFVDNAGVIELDEQDAICFKVETHNHPSAIEPYGGAGTGIGGVIRDILGTGLGARPVMNTDVFCFGPLDLPEKEVPKGAMHPRRILRGVVSGVRDYGNRMGIPTGNGSVHFDPRYTGNPLVYAGSVGLIPRDKIQKAAQAGDHIVVVGGRTGRDGIGGATFSSVELTSESETISAGAVQIGNAIEEQKVQETLLRARDLGLYTAVTDCGAGGLSSAVGEMGEELGAKVELTRVPLKYQGLNYLEVWISEAQERMVISVPPAKVDETLALFRAEDVEATDIGVFSGDGRLVLNWDGKTVLDLPMRFLHDGMPRVEREALWSGPEGQELPEPIARADDLVDLLKKILSSPNVCSKEWIVRQYDHEVQAGSAVKPFTGPRREGPSDACAFVPKPGGDVAVVVSNGLNTRLGDVDPFHMAMSNIDEALRNYVASGGDIDRCAILDNFSWGNCNKPDRMGAMVRACYGCYVAAKGFEVPFISGKDSLNNEFLTEQGESVAIPHTLLISAIGPAVGIDGLITSDLKKPKNRLFLVGRTIPEFAGSHFEMVAGREASPHLNGSYRAPVVYPERGLAIYRAMNRAQREGLIVSAHDCAEGGLAVCLAEMALGGGLGASVAFTRPMKHDGADDLTLLFSESNSRFVIEIDPDNEERLRHVFNDLPLFPLGRVTEKPTLSISGLSGLPLLEAPIEELREAFRSPLYRALGEQR